MNSMKSSNFWISLKKSKKLQKRLKTKLLKRRKNWILKQSKLMKARRKPIKFSKMQFLFWKKLRQHWIKLRKTNWLIWRLLLILLHLSRLLLNACKSCVQMVTKVKVMVGMALKLCLTILVNSLITWENTVIVLTRWKNNTSARSIKLLQILTTDLLKLQVFHQLPLVYMLGLEVQLISMKSTRRLLLLRRRSRKWQLNNNNFKRICQRLNNSLAI